MSDLMRPDLAVPAPRWCLENQKKTRGSAVPQLMPPTRRGARFGPPPANDVPAAEPVVVRPSGVCGVSAVAPLRAGKHQASKP